MKESIGFAEFLGWKEDGEYEIDGERYKIFFDDVCKQNKVDDSWEVVKVYWSTKYLDKFRNAKPL